MKPGECEQHTKNRQLLLTTLWESFKVIDVTGMSSWGDVQDNISLFMDDPNTETGLYALVSLLVAEPNEGKS